MSTETPGGAAPRADPNLPRSGRPSGAVPASGAPPAAEPGATPPAGAEPPAATPPAKPDAGAPLAGGGSAADPEKPVAATWPEDWRKQMAGGDEAYLKQLERFDSPAAVGKSLREAQLKISQGGAKPALPKDATPEQLAAFRKEAGSPRPPTPTS